MSRRIALSAREVRRSCGAAALGHRYRQPTTHCTFQASVATHGGQSSGTRTDPEADAGEYPAADTRFEDLLTHWLENMRHPGVPCRMARELFAVLVNQTLPPSPLVFTDFARGPPAQGCRLHLKHRHRRGPTRSGSGQNRRLDTLGHQGHRTHPRARRIENRVGDRRRGLRRGGETSAAPAFRSPSTPRRHHQDTLFPVRCRGRARRIRRS